MPFDPCGLKVQTGRFTYTTKMRPFKDSSLEVDIVWYPALPTAKVLPFPTFVHNLEEDVWERPLGIFLGRDVGEVIGAPRSYNGEQAKPNTGKGNWCGTAEMFRNGASYDPDVNIARRADGLPVCCGTLPVGALYYYRPFALTAPQFRGQTYTPDFGRFPFYYDVTGLTPDPARVSSSIPFAGNVWAGTYGGGAQRINLFKNVAPFGSPGGWVLDYYVPTSTLQGRYSTSSWDGVGSATFFLFSGSGPATATVTLVP